MNQTKELFSNKQLKAMIIPLFIEQFLLVLVGLADVFIISFAGESAVSGVSLVNSFNTIFIYLFTALAAGGAAITSQYIGRGEKKKASESLSQLLMSSSIFAITVSVIILLFHEDILRFLFGKVEDSVMGACITYLKISVYSYVFLAIYNAGAARYRSIGKTKTTMYISMLSNLVNVIGNVLGVFYFKAGVAGVAIPSLIARALSAIVITALCFQQNNEIRYYGRQIFQWNGNMLKRIMGIAIPNGVESGVFQLVKVALSSVVALFGTYQIAANGVAQSIWSISALGCVTMGPVFITVIGQCMGAGDTMQAERYFKKLLKVTLFISIGWNILIFALTPLITMGFSVSDKTKQMIIWLVLIHNLANAVIFPFADPLGKGLRAAGDAKFTMVISLITTIGVRLVLSILFGITLQMGVIGIALAMCLDWLARGVIFWHRFKSKAWEKFHAI